MQATPATEARNRHEQSAVAAPGDQAVFLTVAGFCKPRALPRSTFYKLVNAGQIRLVKRGRRSLIHRVEAERFDNRLLDAD
jgi:excisionase family DNA binding protein